MLWRVSVTASQTGSAEKFEPGMLYCALWTHPGGDACVHYLLSAVPHPLSEALSPLQPRHCLPAGSVLITCWSLVFRLCSARVPLVFRLYLPWVCPAPPPPHSHSAFRTARTTALQHRDAAGSEMFTVLLVKGCVRLSHYPMLFALDRDSLWASGRACQSTSYCYRLLRPTLARKLRLSR